MSETTHQQSAAIVALAARHHDALDGLAAMTAAAVEGLSAAERDSHTGRLFCGLAALVDQQREQAGALLQLAEDADDASDVPATPRAVNC